MKSDTKKNPSQPPLIRGGNTKLPEIKYIPYNRELVFRARELRKNQTPTEKIFWKELDSHEIGMRYKFTRQKPLDNFIVDFYCARLLLAVEIDGEIHSFSKIRDQERDRILETKYNLLIVRYPNEQVMNDMATVMRDLNNKIKQRVSEFPPDKGD